MRGHTVGYFSAYYRGLEMLLKLWPKIREKVPDAELDVYYGWGSWDALEGENGRAFHERVDSLLYSLSDQGVTEHGRVSHNVLSEAMQQTKVWAYPTEFPEIHCITALKAQAAGCIPVATNVGALPEVVDPRYPLIECANIYSNEYGQDRFVKAVVMALEGPEGESVVRPGALWEDVAHRWAELMK